MAPVRRLVGYCAQHRAVIAYLVVLAVATAGVYRVETLAVRNCNQIERLKADVRQEAIQAYENLDRTLHLLMLERTAEIEAVAREQRDTKLERFAAREC